MLPDIPVTTPFGYAGVALLLFGVFLFVAGLGVIRITQFTIVPGRKTLVLAVGIGVLGASLLWLDTLGPPPTPPTPIPTSTTPTPTPETPTNTLTPTRSPTLTDTPTSTITPTPPPSDTATPTPTLSPTPTDTSTPSPTPPPLVVADFNSCSNINNLGGAMGAAYDDPDRLIETYVHEEGRGCSARLEYEITQWSAFWIKLEEVDLPPYDELLTFDVRGDAQKGIPEQMRIELKRADNSEVSITYVSGITAEWQTISVNLSDFGPTGYTVPLSAFTQMSELVFTFEADRSGHAGAIYLDNIFFRP